MRNLTLLTDLYELTMGYGFFKEKRHEQTVAFDLFFRQNKLITYSLAAGLQQAIEYVENLHLTEDDVAYLKGLNLFDDEYINYLKNMRFTGDIYAVREGEAVFPGEPILTVKAPVIQAQFLETALLNIINHQTLIATKSSKICRVAKGDTVMEFGLRRAQGPDAGIYGARAAVIGGCQSTSNVLAGQMFSIPVSGTMAHSWIMNFPSEFEAFKAYADAFPENCLLLVDTYDTLRSGVPNAIKTFQYLKERGHAPKGIRLDSGDLAYLSKKARKMLDDAGFENTVICASGDLDETSIESLKSQGAKIDVWGVGTKLITSEDMPALGGVYKLVAVYEDGKEIPKIKISDNTAKITNPAVKQVYRIMDKASGKAVADLIALKGETFDQNKPLTIRHPVDRWKTITVENYTLRPLQIPVIIKGERVYEFPTLREIKDYAQTQINSLWEEYTRSVMPHLYKVDLSEKLLSLKDELLEKIKEAKCNV